MPSTIDSYLKDLKDALSGGDPALIQDALFDAEEYLQSELEAYRSAHRDVAIEQALDHVIEKYGSPAEVAEAYRSAEERLPVTRPKPKRPAERSLLGRFFGVLIEPKAYAALFYMFFSLVTGVAYFTWLCTGLGLSLGFLVLIIGLPFLGVFLASVRAVSLMEGRLVEALLGVRMPRRPILTRKGKGWLAQLKAWLSDGYTWSGMGYMALMLPLGTLYFSVATTLCAVAAALVAAPILHFGFDLPLAHFHGDAYTLEPWALMLLPLAGALVAILTLHLVKALGRMQAAIAKGMLVKV